MKTIQNYCLMLMAALAVSVAGAEPVRPDLAGRVTNSDGSAITNATILVYTAAPHQGVSSLCPSGFADCRKQTITGTNGEFVISSLDPTLIFRLLVLAPDHESKFIDKVNPAHGVTIFTMKLVDANATPPDLRISGVVIGDDGQAIVGATIQTQGVSFGNGGQQWGGAGQYADETVVSDAKGHFLIRCKSKVELIYAMASAREAAPRPIQLQPGRDFLVRMHDGVTVTGRLVTTNFPVSGAVLRVMAENRISGEFFITDRIATDSNGRFSIPNLPPEKGLILFGTMDTLQGQGALSPKSFTSGKNKTSTDLGDLILQPGYRISGQIILTDGKPMPARTHLLLARQGASDYTDVVLTADGRFAFQSVPAESVSLSARLKGYKYSHRNPSLDWLNNQIVGKVSGDITNLTLIMEPGEFRYNSNHDDIPEGVDVQPRDKPLRGVSPN
jgi:hypothetical protein